MSTAALTTPPVPVPDPLAWLDRGGARARATLAVMRVYDAEIVRFLRRTLALWRDPAAYDAWCTARLEEMLRWSRRVPFYAQRFDAAGLFAGDRVRLERLADVEPLTKHDIRTHFDALHHPQVQRGRYTNTSGGSTGEPVRFTQDRLFHARGVADTLLFGVLNGKRPGEPEVKLWGSERDLLEGSDSLKVRLVNRIFNRVQLNSFRMDAAAMRRYVDVLARVRPVQVWAYVESIVELARFARAERLPLHQPAVIVCTAGTMYPELRSELESAFPRSRIVNQYGSREVGQIACEAIGVDGLWLMRHSNHVELLGATTSRPVSGAGAQGRVHVTTLNNRSMPLVRFDIGDIAEFAARGEGGHVALARVLGRENAHFITTAGARVHGEFFTHMFYGRDWLDAFQVAQTAPDRVVVRYAAAPGRTPPAAELEGIRRDILRVMGNATAVEFERRDRIERLGSGKFQFVRREF